MNGRVIAMGKWLWAWYFGLFVIWIKDIEELFQHCIYVSYFENWIWTWSLNGRQDYVCKSSSYHLVVHHTACEKANDTVRYFLHIEFLYRDETVEKIV